MYNLTLSGKSWEIPCQSGLSGKTHMALLSYFPVYFQCMPKFIKPYMLQNQVTIVIQATGPSVPLHSFTEKQRKSSSQVLKAQKHTPITDGAIPWDLVTNINLPIFYVWKFVSSRTLLLLPQGLWECSLNELKSGCYRSTKKPKPLSYDIIEMCS